MIIYRMKYLFILITLLASLDALACKERNFPDIFPLDEAKHYDHLFILQIQKIIYSSPPGNFRYTSPFTFEAKVVRSYIGEVSEGAIIHGSTSTEKPHAICPVNFTEGQSYIVMMKGKSEPFIVSRYSLRVPEMHPMFKKYKSELDKINDNEKTHNQRLKHDALKRAS
ncbi:hypothetical protein KA005_37890 [bacterium]|nr:hypothetical protein [bacterium]